MATSIFVYNLTPSTPKLAADIYRTLSNVPDDGPNYFNLQLLNENELSGEYVIVQTVEESFYNPIDRVFEQRKASKATIVDFTICNDRLEIWGNRTNANKLIFAISSATQNIFSINAVNISIENIISKLQAYKVKVSKLSDSRFQMLSDDYEQEQEELREKLLRLNEEITKQEEQAENIDRFIGKVRKYLDLDELTPAVLNDMVRAVYVHAPDKSKGYREQQIDISYDLVGILPASLLNSLQNGETA